MVNLRVSPEYQSCPLGPIPIILPFLKKIRLRETVDSLVPTTKRAEISHGQVMEALVLNRLLSPRALYTVQEWSRFLLVKEVLGIDPVYLNDDRISRTLDAIFPHLEQLQGTLTWRIVETFDIDTSYIHWDMTSFFFEGSYPEDQQDPEAPLIKRGKPKRQDSGKSRKQMQVGLATSSEDGVPFWHRSFNGNAGEVSQVADVMETSQKVIPSSSFTLVGDSKLLSEPNIAAALGRKLTFLAPESRSKLPTDEYFALRDKHGLQRLAIPGKRSRDKKRIYFGLEGSTTFETKEETHRLRRLFIVSSEERRAVRRSRKRQQKKLQEGIDKARRNVGRYSYKRRKDVVAKMDQLIAKTDLQDVIHYRIEGKGRDMKLFVHTDLEAFKRLRQTDGVYTLLTNLPDEHDLESLFTRYKRQHLPEQHFADAKGPLQLRPLFLKKNRRIASLVSVVATALTVYCLMEHTVRRNLKEAGAKMPDLYSRRSTAEPTARRLLAAFEFFALGVHTEDGNVTYTAPPFTDLQKMILEYLDIEDPWSFLKESHGS